jgi:type VI secretion system protein ImpG
VSVWPLEVAGVEYGAFLSDLGGLLGRLPRPARAGLRLRLRALGGLKIQHLALDRLPLFLRGGGDLALRLYEQLSAHTVGLVLREVPGTVTGTAAAVSAAPALVLRDPLAPVGLEDDEALLPVDPRSFHGYRLLQEYFAFPQRFLFTELRGLSEGVRRCRGTELEIVIALDAYEPSLEGAVDRDHVALHCTPAINIFPRRADRIHLSDRENEYHVVPDRTRPLDFEVWSVTDVRGFGTANEEARLFRPLYARPEGATGPEDGAAFYTLSRQPRLLSAKQRAKGPRSSYVGSELYLSLVDADEGPFRSGLKQLAVETLCTNRDLPLHLPIGLGDTDFHLESAAPVASVRVVAGPTAPAVSQAQGQTAWRLISHLALDYLSLVDGPGQEGAAALRDLLGLYANLTDSALRRQVDGVRSVSSRAVTRRLPVPGPTTFGRGVEVTVTCDETAFEGSGPHLLGTVLERFLAKYAAINSFTELALRTLQRGDIRRWPPRIGHQHVV